MVTTLQESVFISVALSRIKWSRVNMKREEQSWRNRGF